MNLLYDVLPGEVADGEEQPNPLPLLGGCGQALIVAADVFAFATAAGDGHPEVCCPCRDVLSALGRRASGIEWLSGTDTETPQTASPASTAA